MGDRAMRVGGDHHGSAGMGAHHLHAGGAGAGVGLGGMVGADDDSPSSDESSGVETWIEWHCEQPGNEFLCEVDRRYIDDTFTLVRSPPRGLETRPRTDARPGPSSDSGKR